MRFLRNKKILSVIILLVFLSVLLNCSKNQGINDYQFPKIISGQVKNTSGNPLENAKVSLITAPEINPIFTNALGFFRFENVPEGRHKLKVELYGYEDYIADVPSAINGISTINPILTKKQYNTPTNKPVSKGPVRIFNNKLQVDFDGDGNYTDYFIKGVAFSPTPIGNRPITLQQEERSLQYLKDLNANTIRTYSGANPAFLTKLASNGIYCILGFWVDYNVDLSIPANREKIKSDWIKFVYQFKDNPGLLIWNLGNEQNYQNGNNQYWYSLCQELAIIAYNIEGEKYHPVAINNGEIFNIGNPSFLADDNSLTYIDLWGINLYNYNLANRINQLKTKTIKPVVITEFGIDALDNRTKIEYETTQAVFDSLNWSQILSTKDICLGGTVFEFTDEWWKDKDPWSHDYGGYSSSQHPDGYSNEEWWGIIRVLPDANNDGLDEWIPREAYYMFQRNWKNK